MKAWPNVVRRTLLTDKSNYTTTFFFFLIWPSGGWIPFFLAVIALNLNRLPDSYSPKCRIISFCFSIFICRLSKVFLSMHHLFSCLTLDSFFVLVTFYSFVVRNVVWFDSFKSLAFLVLGCNSTFFSEVFPFTSLFNFFTV